MAIPQTSSILHHLRQTLLRRDGAGLTDGQLLRSFLHHRDEAAFEALVRRHGPMVRGVCRRVLRNTHDADDAFQAAFLVLLRKASVLAMREVIGDWLHGVAYRTALKARTAEARRRVKEMQAPRREALVEPEDPSDWLTLLDQEISRLPEKYRLPVVLCDLQGRTRKEAAQQLGWPEGTLSGRLSRARDMLARRLTRRGVALSAGALAVGMTAEASARLPFSLVGSTCKTAMGFAVGQAAGVVPAHIAALTEGVVKAMLLSKLKNVAALVMAAALLTAGIGVWRYAAVAGQTEERREENSPAPAVRDVRPLPKIPVMPPVPRQFQIDLRFEREKDGQRKLLAEPRLITLEGRTASVFVGGCRKFQLGSEKGENVVTVGTGARVDIRSEERGKVRLYLTLIISRLPELTLRGAVIEEKTVSFIRVIALGETLKFKTDDKDSTVLAVTATVQETERKADKRTIAAAEKYLKMAEFYRRTGHPDSARFYYDLIRRCYPDTICAQRAIQWLNEQKPPARVGQIFIAGNKKIPDEVILKEIRLFPGQILKYPELGIAEQNLARLKGLKSSPKVSVIDCGAYDDGTFKNIQIAVEEK